MCALNTFYMHAAGHTYERAAITKWIESHGSSPMTNKPLPSKQLIPNHCVRQGISEALHKLQTTQLDCRVALE